MCVDTLPFLSPVLQEDHLKEMKVMVVGDRVRFLEYLKLLKKLKRDADRSKSLWTATTPVKNCAYHKNCGSFCFLVGQYIVLGNAS